MTVADIARVTREPMSKLYHHVDVLLDAGLIQVVRRLKKRGTEERFLRAVAKDFSVDDALFLFGAQADQGIDALLEVSTTMLHSVADEIVTAARGGAIDPRKPGRRVFLEQQELRLSERAFEQMCARLDQWIDEAKENTTTRGGRVYRFATVFFPSARNPVPERKGRRR